MPGMDGVMCARLLAERERPRHPTPPVLMLTAFSRHEVQQQLDDQGVTVGALLTKPVTPSTLFDACATALGLAVAPTTRRARREESLQGDRAALRGARLLLVEDNAFNQELALDVLGRAGIETRVAANGQEALAMLARHPFDGVLMDCQMPVMDGFRDAGSLDPSGCWGGACRWEGRVRGEWSVGPAGAAGRRPEGRARRHDGRPRAVSAPAAPVPGPRDRFPAALPGPARRARRGGDADGA
jgi:CheY-like chemotaxis protein